MPPLSSRLNIKNLDNSDHLDASPATSSRSSGFGFSDSELTNTNPPLPISRDKDSSNDASNETSDSDKSLVASVPRGFKPKSHALRMSDEPDGSRRPPENHDNDADDEQPADFAEEASEAAPEGVPLEKRFFCSTCNQGFTRKHNMVSHELIHLSLKPHVCPVCSVLFRRIHDLKRHEKLHTGEKPFFCDKCNRRFARPDALTRHLNSPNACSGKPKEDDAEPTTTKPLSEVVESTEAEPSRRSSSSHSAPPRDTSVKVASSTEATEVPAERPLGAEFTDKFQVPDLRYAIVTAGTSSDSLAGISDIINKANYDVHRWRAFQHQQKSLKHNNSYSSNQQAASNQGYPDNEQARNQEHNQNVANNRAFEQHLNANPAFQNDPGRHYHHHHYHHYHNNDDNGASNKPEMGSWSIPSDREVHQDGQFIKHDELYPRDIRGSRKEFERGSSGQIHRRKDNSRNDNVRDNERNDDMRNGNLRNENLRNDNLRNENLRNDMRNDNMRNDSMRNNNLRDDNNRNDNMRTMPLIPRHPQMGYPPSEKFATNVYSSYSDGNARPSPQQSGLYDGSPMPNWRPPDPSFVSMDRYANLVNYTNDLLASMSKMNDRLKFLEKAERKRESDDQLHESATKKRKGGTK